MDAANVLSIAEHLPLVGNRVSLSPGFHSLSTHGTAMSLLVHNCGIATKSETYLTKKRVDEKQLLTNKRS